MVFMMSSTRVTFIILMMSVIVARISMIVLFSVLFLLITGWIGWAGRSYIIAVRSRKSPEENEIIIDVPLAIQCSLGAAAWPLLAFKEMSTGEMFAKEDEITVSPR